MDERQLRVAICAAGKRLDSLGLVGGTEGNLSVRLGGTSILATPRGANKGALRPEDMVECPLDQSTSRCENASTEILIHLISYHSDPNCRAVVHAHPPHATAYACSNEPFPSALTAEAIAVLGHVPTLPFAMPGTAAVAEGMARALPGCSAMLLSHHGAVCLGADLDEAMMRMEILERVAQLGILTRQLGGAKAMPADVLDELRRKP